MSRELKTHMIAECGEAAVVSFCGLTGSQGLITGTYVTSSQLVFIALDKERHVTCKSCLRALKKAKNAH